jgi:hypothetical protein
LATVAEVEAQTYPRLAAYVAQLPDGLDSYPSVVAKASMCRTFAAGARFEGAPPGLPAIVSGLAASPPPVTAWIPEAHLMALLLAVADLRDDDTGFVAWMYDANRAVLKSPWYSVLMSVSSPMMLLRGTEMRWGALHKGTEVTATRQEKGATIHFDFPPRLYTPLLLRAYGEAFRAAIDLTNARDASVVLSQVSSTRAAYDARWS